MAAKRGRKIKKILISLVISFLIIPSPLGAYGYQETQGRFTDISPFTIDGWEFGHTNSDLQYIANNYKFLITDGYSYYNSKVPYLRQLNPNLIILAYRNATVIVKDSFDWEYITANYPDWFLRDSQGNLIYEKDYPLNYLLDPENEGWKAYRADQLKKYVNIYGYDGVFLDVVHPWIKDGNYLYYNAQPVNPRTGQLYTNAQWYNANLNFLDYMNQAIDTTGNKLLIFNGIGTGSRYYNYNMRPFLDKSDGAMVEGFMRWGGNTIDYFKPEVDWKRDVDVLTEIAGAAKINLTLTGIFSSVQATDSEVQRVHLYSLASYLLGTDGETYYDFRWDTWTTRYQPYDNLWSLKIGSPLNNYYKQDNLYQRDFTKGKVLVNPTDLGQSYTINLGGYYQTPEGKVVNSITLAPKTGTVLIKPSDTTPPGVFITSPSNNAKVSGTVSILGSALDNVGVSRVEFYIDGYLKSTATSSPYEFSWDTTLEKNSGHIIKILAYDTSGNQAETQINVTVNNPHSEPTPNPAPIPPPVPSPPSPPSPPFLGVDRLWGESSEGTAVAISKAGWASSEVVLLARNDYFADALAGAVLSHAFRNVSGINVSVPLLLTEPRSLNQETRGEIERLGAETVIILGGPGAILPQVERELWKIKGIKEVQRIWGNTAPGTARDIFERVRLYANQNGTPKPDTAIIATQVNFQDALAVSSPAAANSMPILLSNLSSLPQETLEALSQGGIKRVIIVGGGAVVSSEVEAELNKRGYPVLVRLWGNTEYDTAIDIVQKGDFFFHFTKPGAIFVARGDFFTDALSGGALASRMNPAPILLVEPNSLPSISQSYLQGNKSNITKAYILGGPGAISPTVEDKIKTLFF